MAPRSRKSKASSAAAAAAACREWKVGDLVLAKVKGFPAWPATISEPEKWGYSADWKKVLVYFFGTKQIAFCNPADVEAFTEEKRESLLGKRQGKGADFVRAVKEISASYEKSKKQDRIDDVNAGDEVIRTNARNSLDSLPNSRLRDQTEASSGTFISQLNSYGTMDRDEVCPPVEDAVTNASHDRGALSEEPIDDVVAETSFASTYSSRKTSVSIQPHSKVKQRRDLRSRSSSRSQNLMVPCNDGGKSVKDITSNILRDGSLRRNKQIRTSPDASEMHGAGSPAFVYNGSIEDDGSEIVTVDSDTLSFNEGSTLEFGSNVEHVETDRCLEGTVKLGEKLDFQINAVVTKKKRKLNRKRVISDAPEFTALLDIVADGEEEMHKSKQNLPNICEKSVGGFSKEDGDEHLPLVKRARVRMGKQSALGDKLDSFIEMEENSSKEGPSYGLVHTSLNFAGDNSTNRNSFMLKEDVVNSSPSNICFQFSDNRAQIFENRKNQAFGSLDGEAALPPSKRLHRALEAMSANVAEDGVASAETPFIYQHKSKERKAENNLGVYVDSHGHNASENHTSQISAVVDPLISEENKMSFVNADNWTQPVISSKCSKDEFETAEGVVQAGSTDQFSPDLDGKPASLRIDQDSLDQLSPKNEEKCENMGSSHGRLEIPVKEVDTSESTRISTDPVAEANIITKVSPQNGTPVHLYSKEGTFCDNTKSLKISLDDSSQVDGMCEIVREVNNKSFQHTEKVPTAIWGSEHLSHSASISDDSLGEKDVIGIQSRPSPAYGSFFPTRDSPSHNSRSRMTKIGGNNFLQNNGYCSSEVQLHEHDKKAVHALDVDEEKSDSAVTSVGKSNHADAGACLTSFETMLGALTRTKDSIGRATRIAIECVKYGSATKVVDILVRNLEKEPSLHKRVDLFFLVDSITQCSRGLKGDVRGIFPSAIQSVLPRLLSAAAPPGNTARENRRQCLKVLRLWLERRILPESIVRDHMRHLDSLSCSSSTGAFSRRPLRNERAFDDPLREMEGMLVDEYGSNSSFQLPGFCMPRMLKVEDDGSDSDGGSFEAVTPEHNSETPEEHELIPTVRKHRHILEDVDGELEMEDVAPSCEDLMSDANEVYIGHTSNHEQYIPSSLAPPLPEDVPPSSPPLPTSPPPPPPPLPPPLPPHPSAVPPTYTNGVDIKLYVDTNNLQAVTQQEVALRTKPMISDALNYHAPERQNFQMETRLHDSTATCSSGNIPVSHVPMGPTNNVPLCEGDVLHNKAYLLPPPPHTPSSQFSYAHADRQVQSWRDTPFPHDNRYHFRPNMDGGNFYTDHDRSIPHEFNERWRFSGPVYPHDRAGVPPAPVPYIQGEPSRIRNQGWAYPSQEMNYRNSMPIRPSREVPRYWRPR